MVAAAGESAGAAWIIGEACSLKRVMTTGLILGGADKSDEALGPRRYRSSAHGR